MEEMKQKYGLLSQSKPPYEVLRTNWLSYEEVIRLKVWKRWWRSITTAGSSAAR